MTNPPRGEDVVRRVREQIVTGQVQAGTFLRLEHLAEEMGVSVTPVREAMMQLRSEGFVEWQPRRGFVVLPLTRRDIEDVYRVHAFVAADLARNAVRRLRPVDVDRLEELQDQLEQAHAQGDADQVEQLNHQFHRTINTAADSPRLAHLLRTFTQYAPRLFFAEIAGWPEASASDHRAIIAAIRALDEDAAAAAIDAHIRQAGTLLADHIDRGTRP
ncbi:GntR family transcriptional regulator [Nocardioides sp. AN3]